MKKKRGRFFGRRFSRLMILRKSSKNPEEVKLAEDRLRKVYASADVMLFPFGEKARKRRIGEEIQKILKSKKRETSLIRIFHREFLGREA